MSAVSLLLADARFPAGGHAHSGGVEPAVTARTVTGLASLELFLRGRLRTAGLVSAALAAAACAHGAASRAAGDEAAGPAAQAAGGRPAAAGEPVAVAGPVAPSEPATARREGACPPARSGGGAPAAAGVTWDVLDAEADARTPSPAQREASRRQGRALLRAARAAWPEAGWLGGLGRQPHHPVALGAVTAAAGGDPPEAARIAAYQAVAGPASAAVRLLALDPMQAAAIVARLAGAVDAVAAAAAAAASGPLAELPFPSAPALDLLAEAHARAEVRLFES
jgi:urease accessory protein